MNLEKFQIRTDLAFESLDMKKMVNVNEVLNEEFEQDKLIIKRTVISDVAANELGRKPGVYYALDTKAIKTHDNDDLKKCEDALTKIIKEVMKIENINPSHRGLVVGLGNMNVTPDALGPTVIDNVIVTRHMFILNPEEVSEGISNVSAVAPGVMGNTGIETFDIVEAIVNKIQIDYIVVIDALAAKSVSRVNKTIQVTNTGISPGSGVGNSRKELSKETMGIPVIAIGVPTVVDAVTIVSDTIDLLVRYFTEKIKMPSKPSDKLVVGPQKLNNYDGQLEENQIRGLLGEIGILSEEEKIALLSDVLTPNGYNLMVTPKEVDLDIADLSSIISSSIDRALHTIVDNNYIIS